MSVTIYRLCVDGDMENRADRAKKACVHAAAAAAAATTTTTTTTTTMCA